jgi:DNA-binding response OmpR family regulator
VKILIADDDGVTRTLLRRTLEGVGYEVIETGDGREAWDRFHRETAPIVIVDWMMPLVNGLELCRMIRAERRRPYTYIIMLTALGGKGSYLEGIGAGADDFITKPFDPDELKARLRVAERILDLHAEVKQLQRLLPVCAYCRRIREEDDSWIRLEQYLTRRTDAALSHGICPDCYEQHVRPELDALGVPRT